MKLGMAYTRQDRLARENAMKAVSTISHLGAWSLPGEQMTKKFPDVDAKYEDAWPLSCALMIRCKWFVGQASRMGEEGKSGRSMQPTARPSPHERYDAGAESEDADAGTPRPVVPGRGRSSLRSRLN
jgi:hypothetical protein